MVGLLIVSFATQADAAQAAAWLSGVYACSEPDEVYVDPQLGWSVLVEVPDRLCVGGDPTRHAVEDVRRAVSILSGRLDERRADDPASGYHRLRAPLPGSVVLRYLQARATMARHRVEPTADGCEQLALDI